KNIPPFVILGLDPRIHAGTGQPTPARPEFILHQEAHALMSKPIFILNGPNLNRLGKREPHIYGTTTLDEVEAICREAAGGRAVRFHQSNAEHQLADWVHEAIVEGDGILINPAGLS